MRYLIIFLFWSSIAYTSEVNLKCIYTKDKSKIASLKINFKTQEYQWQSFILAPFHLENNIVRGVLEYQKDVKTNTTMFTAMEINRDTGILMAKFYSLTDKDVKTFVDKTINKLSKNKGKREKNASILIETNVLNENFTDDSYAIFECKKSETKF